jgi:hypothetical protein
VAGKHGGAVRWLNGIKKGDKSSSEKVRSKIRSEIGSVVPMHDLFISYYYFFQFIRIERID